MTSHVAENPPTRPGPLRGQVALVTGASSGLGRRFATVLSAHGVRVAAAARRVDRLDELAAECGARGDEIFPVALDLTDVDSIVAAVERTESEVGPISILVNNAAVVDAQYATRMPIDIIDSVLATNVRGPFILAREVAKRMIQRNAAGRIVNISSIAAYQYAPNNAASMYSVSKAAINRMTEVLATEWARYHINVNAIAPGTFASEMVAETLERLGPIIDDYPRRRLGSPSQLDSTLLYLVAPESDFVTGTIIRVDDAQTPLVHRT